MLLTEERKKEIIMGVIKPLFLETANKTADELIAFILNINTNDILKALDDTLIRERDRWLEQSSECKSIAKEIDEYRKILRRN